MFLAKYIPGSFFRICYIVALWIAISPQSARAQAAPTPSQKWALLIGIDQYKDSNRINSLGSAAADARAIKKALIEADGFPEEHIRLLVSDADPNNDTEAKPERNAILRELSRLARNVQPGDTVFILFSGHGIESGGASYLLPYDTDAFDVNTITDTAIDTAKFRDRLQAIHAGLVVLALDMCRNNPIKGSRDAAALENTLKKAQVRGLDFSGMTSSDGASSTSEQAPRAVVTLFSCSPDERSYEWTAKGRGYFSWYLEQGLRGVKGSIAPDGAIRVDTLTRYLAQNVPDAVNREEGKKQTPFAEIRGQIEASRLALVVPNSLGASVPDAAAGKVLAQDPRAYLKLAVSPGNASILLDGIPIHLIAGMIAIDLKGEAGRKVKVAIQEAGYSTKVKQITLRKGTIVPIAITLERIAVVPVAPSANGKVLSTTTLGLDVSRLKFGLYLHFGLPTFADTGTGTDGVGLSPAAFAPKSIDFRDWVRTAKQAGMTFAVLTAKHETGFCLWPSAGYNFDVGGSPSRTDVLGAFISACQEEGIAPGVHYSIPDIHNEGTLSYTSAVGAGYFDIVKRQLAEIHTKYPGIRLQIFDVAKRLSANQFGELCQIVRRFNPACHILLDPNQEGLSTPDRLDPNHEYIRMLYGSATVNLGWMWSATTPITPAQNLYQAYINVHAKGETYILNVGIDQDGRIPETYKTRLMEVSRMIAQDGH